MRRIQKGQETSRHPTTPAGLLLAKRTTLATRSLRLSGETSASSPLRQRAEHRRNGQVAEESLGSWVRSLNKINSDCQLDWLPTNPPSLPTDSRRHQISWWLDLIPPLLSLQHKTQNAVTEAKRSLSECLSNVLSDLSSSEAVTAAATASQTVAAAERRE